MYKKRRERKEIFFYFLSLSLYNLLLYHRVFVVFVYNLLLFLLNVKKKEREKERD